MSWRAIQDTVAASESLASLSHGAERLYWRLLAATDPHGRLAGSTAKVRAQCLPLVKARDAEIEKWMSELEEVNRIIQYNGDGRQVIQIVDFDLNQPTDFLRKRGESKYPAPPKKRLFAGDSGHRAEEAGQGRPKGSLEGEGEGEVQAPNGASSASVPTDQSSYYAEAASKPPLEPMAEPLAASREHPDKPIRRLYDHWRAARSKTDHRYDQISPERRRKIAGRLKEFSEDELHRALDAVALDPWEERARNDDILKLFRSRETVDRWLEIAEDKTTMTAGERLRARMAAKGIE